MARNSEVVADRNAPPVTQILAEFVATHPSRGWSDAVDHEAHRTFLNWFGCAVGASRHEAVESALAAVQMLQPAPQARVLGRAEKVDMASAAMLNGISSHTFDFDDTHLKTIIHPAGPVASAVLALAEGLASGGGRATGKPVSGRELIDALVLGIDVACRVGNAVYPAHYDRGWHITGTTGMLGAAAGCARLLGAALVVPPGATGDVDTDLHAKARAAIDAIERGAERVVVHLGAPDEAAHRRDAGAKVAALEAIDAALLAPLRDAVGRADGTLAVCPDHGTDPFDGRHDADAVPALRWGRGIAHAGPERMTEAACARAAVRAPSWPLHGAALVEAAA
jgi:MmgE/PrpD N-terminal domain/Metalloenzyme superfamily